jgi:hypothetical protein
MQDNSTAYVIVSYDRRFIARLPEILQGIEHISPDAEKVYFKQLSLNIPSFRNKGDVARRLATATSGEEVENLELTRVFVFSSDLEQAMLFHSNEIDGELANLASQVHAHLRKEPFNGEYIPF